MRIVLKLQDTQVDIPVIKVARAYYTEPTWRKDGHFTDISIESDDPLATEEFLAERFTKINAVAGNHTMRNISLLLSAVILGAGGLAYLTHSPVFFVIIFLFIIGTTFAGFFLQPSRRITAMLAEFNETDHGELSWSLSTEEERYTSRVTDTNGTRDEARTSKMTIKVTRG
ncbi:UNVERIFIED_CONTAM: hypothetical protein HDU68_012130 [Siphonaria sp. JEL0065]|nr:hypothetical protein HDU68_012130 [Siphonaria sp. JEL0065]